MEDFSANSQIHGYSLKRSGIILVMILFALVAGAQSNLSTKNRKSIKLYDKADKKYRERDFYGAIDLLEQAVVADPAFFEAYVRMGSLYNAMGNEDSVYAKFTKYVQYARDPIASVLEKLSFMAFDRGDYEESTRWLEQFLQKVPERASSPEIALLLQSQTFAQNQLANAPQDIVVKYLPSSVNRFKLQYLPSVTIDDASIFFTKRDRVDGDEDIVVSQRVDGQWTPAISVSSKINSPLNEGACAVSADGRTMIFTSCDGKYGHGSCDLYISKKTGGDWSKPKNLGKPINSRYWESQPSLSADGNTLYFSSNRPGGLGGRDLWVASYADGKWSVPVNLGSNVNSRKDETTPYIHPNGISLYFSGNGYPGMGGYDLFVCTRKDSIWSKPENLGYPINTYKDEVAIVISPDGTKAYFAKEEQKNYEILDSRLVSIELPEQIRPQTASYIQGLVTEKGTGLPLGAFLEVIDINNNQLIYKSESDSVSGQYYMVLPTGLELAAYVKKRGYLYSDFHFITYSNDPIRPDTINIALSKVTKGSSLILKNIYFELDSYALNRKSISEIDNAFELLADNPGIIVEIAGHTDNSGSAEYNERLSTKRAEVVFNELVQRGIQEDRMSFRGYSDQQPLLPNTTDSNRKSNRRIEFRVIRVNQ